MPYHQQVLLPRRLGLIVLADYVAGRDIRAAVAAAAADPDWQDVRDVVWDCRRIRQLVVGAADVEAITSVLPKLRSRIGAGRSAVLARGETDDMIARLLWLRARPNTGRELRVFEQAVEAAAWLGVAPEVLADS